MTAGEPKAFEAVLSPDALNGTVLLRTLQCSSQSAELGRRIACPSMPSCARLVNTGHSGGLASGKRPTARKP
jgi:hypothetical protein